MSDAPSNAATNSLVANLRKAQGVQNGIDKIQGTKTVVPKAGTLLVFKIREAGGSVEFISTQFEQKVDSGVENARARYRGHRTVRLSPADALRQWPARLDSLLEK
jgi:hypothetical protein